MLSRFRLIPRDERFLDWFNQAAENNLEAARLLAELLERHEEVERKARRLKDLEHRGDELTQQIFVALNRAFVTPFDREDIGALTSSLDEVIDWIEECARRVYLYRLDEPSPTARHLARIVVLQCEQIAQALPLLGSRRQADQLERAAQEIHFLENEADDVLAEAVGTLYDGVAEVPTLIRAMRWGDIYQLLEDASDRCHAVATVLRSIRGKQS